jgi:hypothetical protein
MADQPALGPDGQLLDASEIEWFNDPDDAQPIQPISCMQGAAFLHITLGTTKYSVWSGQRSRPVRATAGTRLAAAIAAEKLDEFGNPIRVQSSTRRLKPRDPVKRKRAAMDVDETDADDKNFSASSIEDGSDGNSDVMEISNEEVRNFLS